MSLQPDSAAAVPPSQAEPQEFSPEERQLLLTAAKEAIAANIDRREIDLTAPTPHLAERRGAFTTLHIQNELRGCVGYVFPTHSLYRTVAETAIAAAFHDTRFAPLQPDELTALEIQISVLSPLQPIDAEDVEVGRHGLVVTFGSRRGLLLPQVPVEHRWDRETFLAQTCLKAGLPPDAWQRGATLEAFTAEIFGTSNFTW
ncbi:MAG TPA: AmmeMemoRadiSam system protein A [Terriglobales bacterium]|nr:AmmeMemoRadiSam system protein A [Terriglobales bacterium]